MSAHPEPRQPRAFDADDPGIVEEPLARTSRRPRSRGCRAAGGRRRPLPARRSPISAQRGLRWGALLVSALAGAAALGAAAWFARLVSAALVREDWIGWTTLVAAAGGRASPR